ncbi:MAG: radical SAM protein [Deltaproteobacteria bacterium]|nr:radical SAM protein [Deltaproteobacteria bacterium]
MKVLLVHPPLLLGAYFANYPSFSDMGMLYLAAFLREKGFDVFVADSLCPGDGKISYKESGNGRFLLGTEPAKLSAMIPAGADAILMSAPLYASPRRYHSTMLKETISVFRKANPGAPVIIADMYIGGIDYLPYDPKALLDSNAEIDFVIQGEAELTTTALLERLQSGKGAFPGGVVYRANHCGTMSPGRQMLIEDLDTLPLPAFDLVGDGHYPKMQAMAAGMDLIHEHTEQVEYLPVMSSRGCPFECFFCAGAFKGNFRSHSPEYFENKILAQAESLGAKVLLFMDDCANADPRRFDKLIQALMKKNFSFDFMNGLRADLLSEETIHELKKAGAIKLTMSAESGDQAVLDKMIQKRLELARIDKALEAGNKAGLRQQVHYMIGFPFETPAQVNRTLSFALDRMRRFKAEPLVQFATPVPGTRLHAECKDNDFLETDPSSLDLLGIFEKRSIINGKYLSPNDLSLFMKSFKEAMAGITDDSVMVEITTACNNACLFCSAGSTLSRSNIFPSLKEVTLWLKESFGNGKRRLELDGGEPTLHPKLFEIIRAAKDLGYESIAMVTNGRRLAYQSYTAKLLDSGLDQVLISVPSAIPKEHDRITMVRDSFRQTGMGIENALATGFQSVSINTVLSSYTLSTLAMTVNWACKMATGSVNIQYCLSIGRAASNKMTPKWKDAEKALKQISIRPEGPDLVLQNIPYCLLRDSGLTDSFAMERVKQDRVRRTASGRLLRFGDLVQKGFMRIDRCSSCPFYITCPGMPVAGTLKSHEQGRGII